MNPTLIHKLNKFSKYIFILWSLNLFFLIALSISHIDASFFTSQIYFLLQPAFFIAIVCRIPWAITKYHSYKNPLQKDPYWLGA